MKLINVKNALIKKNLIYVTRSSIIYDEFFKTKAYVNADILSRLTA